MRDVMAEVNLPRQWVTCGLTDTLPGRHENAKSLPGFSLCRTKHTENIFIPPSQTIAHHR